MPRAWHARLLQPLVDAHRARIEGRHARRLALDYPRWVAAHDTPGDATRRALATRLAAIGAPARIVLWLDTRGQPAAAVDATVNSLQAQTHADWQLLLYGLGASRGAAGAVDPRIRILAPADAATEAAAWQVAAEAAPGAWVGELPPGLRLAPHALLLLAEAAWHAPQAAVVYGDHDHLAPDGQRVQPHFKPDWNPELLLGHAYCLPMALARAASIRQVLPALLGDDGDTLRHGLWLAVTRGLDDRHVVHVPHVLAHLPLHRARVVASAAAVQRHIESLGLRCTEVRTLPEGCLPRLCPPTPAPRVSVIVPTRDGLDLLRPCVEGVLRHTTYADLDLLIVDNGSRDPATLQYLQTVRADPRVQVLRDERAFNYAALNNAAARQVAGEWLLLLNNDTEPLTPGWLTAMVGAATLPGVAAVGARLWYGDGTLQHAGLILGLEGAAGDAHRRLWRQAPGHQGRAQLMQSLSAVSAACMLVRRSDFLALGGFDEERFGIAYNDVDLCLRLRAAGHRIVWTPLAELTHYESKSRGRDTHGERAERFRREFAALQARWGAVLQHDPAYNPNLALSGGAFRLAWPPRVSLLRPWWLDASSA